MFYISDSDSDDELYAKRFERPRTSQPEPDLSSISNPFSQSFTSGQMDLTQQQKLQRMKQAAQRQSISQVSMVSGSTMMSSASKRNSLISSASGTRVQMFDTKHGYMEHSGIIDVTRSHVDEYTLHDDDQMKKPRFAVTEQTQGDYDNREQVQSQIGSQANISQVHAPVQPHISSSDDLEKELQTRGIAPTLMEGEVTHERPQLKLSRLPVLDVSDKPHFLSHTVPKEYGLVKCFIQRERGKFNLFPKYHLYYEDGNQFLLSARKRKKNKSSNYLMSLDRSDLSRKSPNYFGKLRSNFVGTEFIIYDKGENPSSKDQTNIRHELGAILYETNILGTKGPRRLSIITPAVDSDGEFITNPQSKGNPSLIQQYKENNRKNIHVFTNNKPAWNEKLKAYVLNFNGRVTKASVKNFQLVEEGNNDIVILQFGKVNDQRFSLDYRYPLSALQAFAIALSAYDFKLMCE